MSFFCDWDVPSTLTPSPEYGDEKKYLEEHRRLLAEAKAPSRELLIVKHGGLSANVCLWASCNNKALADMYICVEHAYPEFA